MKTKYIQIGYNIPFSNNSINHISVSGTPFSDLTVVNEMLLTHSNGTPYSILTNDINQTMMSLSSSKYGSANVIVVTQSIEENIEQYKYANFSVDVEEEFDIDTLESQIHENYSINSSNEVYFNINGLTVTNSEFFTC